LTENTYGIFGQSQITPKTSILAEFRSRDADSGDLSLHFWPDNFSSTLRSSVPETIYRAGFRHSFAPNSTLIGSYAFSEAKPKLRFPGVEFVRDDTGHSVELRHILQFPIVNATGGFGFFSGDQDEVDTFDTQKSTNSTEITHYNGYVYNDFVFLKNIVLTAGMSIDDFNSSNTHTTQINPKLGILWDVTPVTTLRAATFRTLNPTLISSQTIEPTQVAGFNQLFDDTDGTDAWTFGIGLDQKLPNDFLLGAEMVRRQLSIPLDDPAEDKHDFDVNENFGRVYLYWTPTDWLAASAEYQYQERDDEEFGDIPQIKMRTHMVPLGVRFFHPSGLFAGLRATVVEQNGRFENFETGELESDDDWFWVADATIGYRLPKRYGLIALEARNLFDERFKFQDFDFDRPDQTTLVNRAVAPERMILGRLILTF
jgi:hypothetical protein